MVSSLYILVYSKAEQIQSEICKKSRLKHSLNAAHFPLSLIDFGGEDEVVFG